MTFPETEIKAIPHREHRYETVGDYWYDKDDEENGASHIRVSKMSDGRYEFLVALHEFIEMNLCRFAGIKEPTIKAFDEAYEANRAKDDNTSEPGFDSNAPYRKQHTIATAVETLIAAELGIDWLAYSKEIESL